MIHYFISEDSVTEEKMQKEWTIEDKFDAVVMLTWSDWFTEPVSNRYHYATRFSRHLQVVFVQPDQDNNKYYFENTEFENIVVMHLPDKYTPEQGKMLEKALFIRKIWKPLLWVYNVFFAYFLETYAAPLCVYHATEDYLSLGKDYVRMIKPYIRDHLYRVPRLREAVHHSHPFGR